MQYVSVCSCVQACVRVCESVCVCVCEYIYIYIVCCRSNNNNDQRPETKERKTDKNVIIFILFTNQSTRSRLHGLG